jgi:outer membrane protein TolC
MPILRALIFFLLTLLSLGAGRVTADTISWRDALKETAERNPDLLRARYRIDQAKEQIGVAKGAQLPNISFDAAGRVLNNGSAANSTVFGSGGSGQGGGIRGSSGDNTTAIASAGLALTQNIYTGDRIPAQIREAEALALGSEASMLDLKNQVSFQFLSAAAGLLASQRLVQLSEQFIKRLEENYKIVELRYESGNENKGSFLFAKAAVDQARFELLQARNGVRQAQQEFSRVIGRDGLDPVELLGDIPERPLPAETTIRGIAENTPAVKIAKAAREAAAERVAQARSAFRPTLVGNAALGYQERQGGDNDTDIWSAGLALNYPIFTGGRDTAALAVADADFMAAQSQFVSAVSTANSALRSAYNRYMETIKQIEVNKSFVDAAQVRADIARSRYNNGLMSFEDWDIIERDLINRKRNLVESQRQRMLAEAAFNQTVGEPLF